VDLKTGAPYEEFLLRVIIEQLYRGMRFGTAVITMKYVYLAFE